MCVARRPASCTGRSNRIPPWTSRSPKPERDLVGLCRDFAQKEIAPRAPVAWDEARCPTDLLREMGALGLLGMLIPEEWGGIGMSTVGFVAAMEQIGLADQSVAAAWQAHVTIGSLPLFLFGNDAQRERWLRPLAEGRALGAFGLTEPDAGSDARGIRTRAVRHGRRLADQRPQDVHLQRGHRHVVRRDAAGAHRDDGDGGRRSRASSWRRTRPASRWARRCAASAGAGSTRASCSSTTCGLPTITSSAIPRWGSASSSRTLEVGRISIAALSLSLTQAVLDLAIDVRAASACSSASRSRSSRRSSSSSPTSRPSSKRRAGSRIAPRTCATPGSRSSRKRRWRS